ncbi:Na+/H+ antiporter NhaC family protein [Fretibacter rubidus]|uniref:Na+/H+ antiporter NhaC family protein n=1 Tax=Fretibacter rubidus TaxID=570162 RepID=UPI00352A757B
MENFGLLSLLPPVLAIGLALVTRQVFLSLLAGLWVGFLILAGGNPLDGTFGTINGLVDVFTDAGNTRIIIFTLVVGALIALIQRSGGVQGFIDGLLAKLEKAGEGSQSRVKVELLAMATGLVIFIESNISILTVGTLYRPVFDKLNIPREKLAYIADGTSSPSCILLPFNAWGAFITGLLMAQGMDAPFGELLKATLYNFYPMIVIITIFLVIVTGRNVGEMKKAEARGTILREGAVPMLAGELSEIEMKTGLKPRARNMIVPIAAMVLLMPTFLIMTGDKGNGWLAALQSGSGSTSVLYATTFACLIAFVMYKAQGLLGIRDMFDLSLKGMSGMVPLAILMVLAFALGTLCRELGTGQYVADVARAYMSPALVPAMIFLTACFVAFSTGTSWGTFAIMIAIAVPLAQGMDTNVSLAIAAALGGGVFGDHCSPTSDTSIITSMATGNDHIDHIRTQLPFALIGGALTTGLYLILGFAGL